MSAPSSPMGSRAPRIDEPWGHVYPCRTCGANPAGLLAQAGSIVCAEHIDMSPESAVPLEAAALAAWPDLTKEQHFDRVGTALVVLVALASGAWYFSREGLTWAWDLWEAAVRIRGQSGAR